ncbi:MAG: response regulator [Gemmatimonas sp.]
MTHGTVSATMGRVTGFPVLPMTSPMLKDSPVNASPTKSQSTSRRVLVVDDNGDSADSLAMLLKLDGHETAVAYNGAEAVRMAESFRPDVAILDIGLPILTGHHVAKLIRAQSWGRAMVLIALTGWGQGEDRKKSAEFGIDFHLVKPADTDELRRLIVEAKRSA